jgi:CHASE2 domain-containing sensor protein
MVPSPVNASTLWNAGLQKVWQRGRVWITASGVAAGIIGLRLAGVLQIGEFALYDQMFRWRPVEAVDDRIVLVTVEESDLDRLKQWPMSDVQLSNLLNRIDQAKPKAIGLDIRRPRQQGIRANLPAPAQPNWHFKTPGQHHQRRRPQSPAGPKEPSGLQ